MTKFYGNVGFEVTVETEPGIYTPVEEIRPYYGDVTRNYRKWNQSDKINDDLSLSNEFSIVADRFAYDNFNGMKWIEYLGAKWKITTVEIAYPRLIIEVGGVYNAG